MAVTASVSGYSLLDDCEDSATWNGESPADVTDFYKEGLQCVGFTVRGAGTNDITVDTGTFDLSGTVHFRAWMMTNALKEMTALSLIVSDGTNTGYYNIFTALGEYPGGWYNIVVDLSRAVDSGTKPTDMSACTYFGFRFTHSGTAKNFQNTWIDHCYLGDGITVYGDASTGVPFDFDDILTKDEDTTNGGWGIIRKISGVYFLTGELTFGDSASTNLLDFADESQTIVFEDRPVNAALYEISVVSNSTATTNDFVLGTKTGTAGVSGCAFRTQSLTQTPKFDVTCTDTDVDVFKLYGCSFLDADDITLPEVSGTDREVISCSFEECGDVFANTCIMTNCNFISADVTGLVLDDYDDNNVTTCNFIGCTNGVELTTDTSDWDFTDLVFTGCTNDVLNSTGSAVTVNNLGTSNAASYNATGSAVTFITAKNVNVHVEDANGNDIAGAIVSIWRATETSYTSDTGNNAGDSTFVTKENIDTDQLQTGYVQALRSSDSAVVSFRYASWTSKTFTLPTEITGSVTTAGGVGEESTQLIDSAADFGVTEDVEEGDAIRNTTDGSWALVDQIIDTDELKTLPLSDGTDNEWDLSDAYSIHRLPITFGENDTVRLPLFIGQTDTNGDMPTYVHNYNAGAMNIVTKIRYRDGATKYKHTEFTGQIGASGYSLDAVISEDVA